MRTRTLSTVAFALLSACAPSRPDAILYDVDGCAFCLMAISDGRFAAAALTTKGKTLKFDSIECLLAYAKRGGAGAGIASKWVGDFRHPGTMLRASTATFVDLGPGRAPMGRGLAAVVSASDAEALGLTSTAKRWSALQ